MAAGSRAAGGMGIRLPAGRQLGELGFAQERQHRLQVLLEVGQLGLRELRVDQSRQRPRVDRAEPGLHRGRRVAGGHEDAVAGADTARPQAGRHGRHAFQQLGEGQRALGGDHRRRRPEAAGSAGEQLRNRGVTHETLAKLVGGA